MPAGLVLNTLIFFDTDTSLRIKVSRRIESATVNPEGDKNKKKESGAPNPAGVNDTVILSFQQIEAGVTVGALIVCDFTTRVKSKRQNTRVIFLIIVAFCLYG